VRLSPSHADRLAAAKLWLISTAGAAGPESPRNLPYLAHALYALIPVESAEVPAITCDEHWRIYVNPGWLETAPVRAIGTELVHLLWHLLHEHADRARDMRVDATTAVHWKRACDAAIVGTLHESGLAGGGLTSPADLELPPGLSAEQYYAMISRLPAGMAGDGALPPDAGCGSGCDGIPRAHELPPGMDVGEIASADARQIRRLVAIAYREHVTSRGETPGDAWRWTQDILEPRIAWQPLLGSAVRRAVAWTNGNTHYTFSRRSRRQSALPDVVLPGMRRPVPNVAFVVDTSGSVDDVLLGRALGEVDGALNGLGVSGSSVTVLACDAAVQAVAKVRTARDAKLAGGGGTDMRAGLSAAGDLRPRPDVIVVFTDGYTPWPAAAPPGAAVIAALLGRDGYTMPPTPNWARRIECRL
jgi:predicted metal-dependent peptidase